MNPFDVENPKSVLGVRENEKLQGRFQWAKLRLPCLVWPTGGSTLQGKASRILWPIFRGRVFRTAGLWTTSKQKPVCRVASSQTVFPKQQRPHHFTAGSRSPLSPIANCLFIHKDSPAKTGKVPANRRGEVKKQGKLEKTRDWRLQEQCGTSPIWAFDNISVY